MENRESDLINPANIEVFTEALVEITDKIGLWDASKQYLLNTYNGLSERDKSLVLSHFNQTN